MKYLSRGVLIYYCYYLEKLVYGSCILVWLSIKVETGLLPWAACSLEVLLIALLMVLFNEMILDKVSSFLLVKF